MTHLKSLLFFVSLLPFTSGIAQKLEHANELYNKGYYAAAIPIFEDALRKKINSTAQSKLADCYRILNKADKAADYYAQLVADSTARNKDIFNYGEVMMMRGKYDSARYFFQKFAESEPDDKRGADMLTTCDNMSKIKPLILNVKVTPFPQNSDADEHAPIFYKNQLIFTGDRSQGFRLLKQQNKTVGRDYYAIWSAEKVNDTTFSKPKIYSKKLALLNKNTGNVSFTQNGKEAFFCRNNDYTSKSDAYNMQIYSAHAKDGENWSRIEKLPFCSAESNYMYPSVSPDGKHLFFVMERGDGFGGLDIYVTHRSKKGWTRPQNLGANVNTAANEAFPFAAVNGKLYFCSKGHIGYGGFDIFMTEQDDNGDWKTPVNIGSPFNSAYDDICIAFADSTHGAFASPRSGRGDDIYFFEILPETEKSQTEQLTRFGKFVFGDKSSVDTASENLDDLNSFFDDGTTFQNIKSALDSLALLVSKREVRAGQSFLLENIVYDSAYALEPTAASMLEVDNLASLMSVHRTLEVEIDVHTEGGVEKAKPLAQKRAEWLINYLVEHGITAERLSGKAIGTNKPLKDCKKETCTEEEALKNRRIELIIIDL